jgi:hypothetical protein
MYKIDDNKLILCLWIPKKAQLNSALRSMGRDQELVQRLTEWLEELQD